MKIPRPQFSMRDLIIGLATFGAGIATAQAINPPRPITVRWLPAEPIENAIAKAKERHGAHAVSKAAFTVETVK